MTERARLRLNSRAGLMRLALVTCLGLLIFVSGLSWTEAAPITIRVLPGAWSGDTVEFVQKQAQGWAEETGNKVVFASSAVGSTEVLALIQQYLTARSTDIDIYAMDVVWPGMLGSYFIDLKPYLTEADIAKFDAGGIRANTVDGRLVGLPFYGDTGLLYYRVDLLQKYGYASPPKTWTELREMAVKIQAAERAAGNGSFWGFVFDGAAYEGLTCGALEWVYSYGGGTFVDGTGKVTIDNPNAVAALSEMASWIGTIVPPGVTSYKTEDARGVWQAGNAAFMRNWPFAYALGNRPDSPIRDKFAVCPVPRGPNGQSSGTLGGWQLAVSKYSRNPEQAASLLKYLTKAELQKERMMKISRTPTLHALFGDPEITAAYPWLKVFANINTVARPAAATGAKYSQVSSAIWTAVQSILLHQVDAQTGVKRLADQLEKIKGSGW